MKTLALLLLLATPVFALNDAKLLDAIAQVETGNRPRPGRALEVSAYQMTPAVWLSYSGTARQRAAKHLQWLKSRVPNPTAYRLALAWNGGLGALRNAKPATVDYATRVENLYHD